MKEDVISSAAVWQVLRDYWGQYTARPFKTIVSFVGPALGTILVFFVPPLIMGNIINTFSTQGHVALAPVLAKVLLLGGLWLIGEAIWRLSLYFLIRVEADGTRALAKTAFERLTARDYDFYTNHFVGSLTKKALAFSRSYEAFTDTMAFNVTNNVLPIIFAVVILWQYSPWIPGILIFCLGGVIVLAIPLIRRRSKLVAARHDTSSKVSGRLSDVLTNMFAVKSFAQEIPERTTYGRYVDDMMEKFKKAADYNNGKIEVLLSPIYVFTNVLGLAAAIFFAEKFSLQPGTVVVVFSYYSLVTRVFWEINRIYRNIESSIGEAAEFTQLFLVPPVIADAKGAPDLKLEKAAIEFDKVTFAYPAREDEGPSFLHDFNLKIEGNQKVGLVGPSGGGKTTITKLLLRFIDTQEGSITIDGQNISKVTQKSLRSAIAYVPQEPLLFHRSLFENIAYSNEGATREEVIAAAKIAHADDFIADLPDGYDTLVGERGIKLSGGQRQRIAIARALLKKSSVLVLDEATSSLDSESEKYIQQGLFELMKDKTALVIAHRLSTIKNLDRIIVLDDGKIVQDGTHAELIAKRGLYAKLWSHQTGEFL